MAQRFKPQMGRQPWLNEQGKQDRREGFPHFELDVDKASFTHRPKLHSKELNDHLYGTLDPMEFLKLRQSASAAEAHRTAKKAMRSGLSSIYSQKNDAPLSPPLTQSSSTSRTSRPGSAPGSTRSNAFPVAAAWDVWTLTRQVGVVRFRKNPAQLTLSELRTVITRQVPELPQDFQFMYEDGVLIHRAQEPALGTKRQRKTKKVFVHFLEDFDDRVTKKHFEFTGIKLSSKLKTSMKTSPMLESPAQPIQTTSKPITQAVAASPSSAFIAVAPVESTTRKGSFEDKSEPENYAVCQDMQSSKIESSTQTAIESTRMILQEGHTQTNTSQTSSSMLMAIRKQIAQHEEFAARTIQKLVRHVLRVRRQARERDYMQIADYESTAAREQLRIELERAQKVAAEHAALKAEKKTRDAAVALKEEAEAAERVRVEAEAVAERARQAAVTMDVTSAHGIISAKLATLLLQQFQYQEAVKANAATALIQNLARKRIAKRPKKLPSSSEEERKARIDELAAQEMASATRDAQQAAEDIAAANEVRASIAREAEVADEKVAKTEAIAARARARFTRVKSRMKVMQMLGKASNSTKGFPKPTAPSLDGPSKSDKLSPDLVGEASMLLPKESTVEKTAGPHEAEKNAVKLSLDITAWPVHPEHTTALVNITSNSEKVDSFAESMEVLAEVHSERPIPASVESGSTGMHLEQKATNAEGEISQVCAAADLSTSASNLATVQRNRSSLTSKSSPVELLVEAEKFAKEARTEIVTSPILGSSSVVRATNATRDSELAKAVPQKASALFFEEDWNFLEKPLAEAEAGQAQGRLADAERNINNLLLMEVAAKARMRAIEAKADVEKQRITREVAANREARERDAEVYAAQNLEVQKLKAVLAKGGLEHQQYLKSLQDVAVYEAQYKKVIEDGARQRALLEKCTLYGDLHLHARHSKSWWAALQTLPNIKLLCDDGLEDWERRRGLFEVHNPSNNMLDDKDGTNIPFDSEVPTSEDHTNPTLTLIPMPKDSKDVLNGDFEPLPVEAGYQWPLISSESIEGEDSLSSDGGSTGTSLSITSLPRASTPDLFVEDDLASAAATSLRRLNFATDLSCILPQAHCSLPLPRLSPPLPELPLIPLDRMSATGRAAVTTPPLTWDCSSALSQAGNYYSSEGNALLGARPALRLSASESNALSPHLPLPVDTRLDGCRTPDNSQTLPMLDVVSTSGSQNGQTYGEPAAGDVAWVAPSQTLLSPRSQPLTTSPEESTDEPQCPILNLSDTTPLALQSNGDGAANPSVSPLHTPTGTIGRLATPLAYDNEVLETALLPLDTQVVSVDTSTAIIGQPAALSASDTNDLQGSTLRPLDTPMVPISPLPLIAATASLREASYFNSLNSAEKDVCNVARPGIVPSDTKLEVTAALEPLSTSALEAPSPLQSSDSIDTPVLAIGHTLVEEEKELMVSRPAIRLAASFRHNTGQAVPLTGAVKDFLTHPIDALPNALLATNNALDEQLGCSTQSGDQLGNEAWQHSIGKREVDGVVPRSCDSMDAGIAVAPAGLVETKLTTVAAAISRVVARQGVRFDDGRRLVAWLEQSKAGSTVRTVHAYDPLDSETFAATVSPGTWAAAITEARKPEDCFSFSTALISDEASDKITCGQNVVDDSEETEAIAARIILGWLSVSATKGLTINVPENTILPLTEPLSPHMNTSEQMEEVPSHPDFKGKRSSNNIDALFHRCVTKLVDGRRLMVWLQYGFGASPQNLSYTGHSFDPISAQTHTCSVPFETWEAAQQMSTHRYNVCNYGQVESPAGTVSKSDIDAKKADAESILFGWLRLNQTQGLHFHEPHSSRNRVEVLRDDAMHTITASESMNEAKMMHASGMERNSSLRNLESLSPSRGLAATEPKTEAIMTNFQDFNLTPRSGSGDDGSDEDASTSRRDFNDSMDLNVTAENESIARSTSSTGGFSDGDENVMIDVFRHPWRALQHNLPALTKGQFVDGQLLLVAVTLHLPSLIFHITATPVAGSKSYTIEVERATWAHVLPRLPPLPFEAEYNTGKHYQRIASELVRCMAFTTSRKLMSTEGGGSNPEVDAEHMDAHAVNSLSDNTQLVLRLRGLSSDSFDDDDDDEDEKDDESTVFGGEIRDIDSAVSPLYTTGVTVGDQFLVVAAHNDQADQQLVLEVYNDDSASTHMLAIRPEDWGLRWQSTVAIDRRAFAKSMCTCLSINDQGLPTLPALIVSRASAPVGSDGSTALDQEEEALVKRVVLPEVCNLSAPAVPLASVEVPFQGEPTDQSSDVPSSTLVVSAYDDKGADGCFVCALDSTNKKHYHGRSIVPGWNTFSMASKSEWARQVCQNVSFSNDSLSNAAIEYSGDNDDDNSNDCNGDWVEDGLGVTFLTLVDPLATANYAGNINNALWLTQKPRYTSGRMISGAWHICKIFALPRSATVDHSRDFVDSGGVRVEAFNPLTVEAFTLEASRQKLSSWCGDEAAACLVGDGDGVESTASTQQEQLFEALLNRLRIRREGEISWQ